MIVSQLTARRDYAVPKILYENNMLSMLFTDAYYNVDKYPIFNLLDRTLPSKLVKTYHRYDPNIPIDFVRSNWALALKFRYQLKAFNPTKKYLAQINAFKANSEFIIRYCNKNKNINSYYGFDSASKEFFEWAKPKGFSLYLDQCIAPRYSQILMYKKFQDTYGVNQQRNIEQCMFHKEREEREWELTNKILAPSSYVKSELLKAGAPENKIFLVPFGYESPYSLSYRKKSFETNLNITKDKLNILFVGNSGLRKGIYDFLMIAKHFNNYPLKFNIVGSIQKDIFKYIENEKIKNVNIIGKLNRQDLNEIYKSSDIFCFPTYLEGSARVVFEAMSWGLPVLSTYQSGSVITNELDGFLVDAGQINNMIMYIQKLISSKELRFKVGEKALYKVEEFNLNNYAKALIPVLT
ncbi:glycosyltransferase family 4 protein [Chondrinema litorale]|uniref:glycosyltransferase family 4 protein n=1 Tax=Chondrinema litorale TaxID=2994555 RepID=UPI002543C3AF|nr:glycosyltransferase family 4 protein [Chondrinema litorale]UZR95495.1 glycosyltransferase family 4 protein [Chondrinema litorale]